MPRLGSRVRAPLSAPTILRGSNEPRFLLTLREPRAPHLAPQSSVAYIKYASLLFRGSLGYPEPARCRGRGSRSSILFTNWSIRPRGPELFSNYSKIVLAFGWIIPYIKSSQADMAQLVEHNLAKVGVAGSSPVVRSIWAFSSGGERFPDTEEVRSSNLLTPTKCSQLSGLASELFFCHQARRQISHQILIQGLYTMIFASRRGTDRLHTSWPIVTATCWSSIIFWILLA